MAAAADVAGSLDSLRLGADTPMIRNGVVQPGHLIREDGLLLEKEPAAAALGEAYLVESLKAVAEVLASYLEQGSHKVSYPNASWEGLPHHHRLLE